MHDDRALVGILKVGGGQLLIKFSENVSKKAILFNKFSKSGGAMPPSNEGPVSMTLLCG